MSLWNEIEKQALPYIHEHLPPYETLSRLVASGFGAGDSSRRYWAMLGEWRYAVFENLCLLYRHSSDRELLLPPLRDAPVLHVDHLLPDYMAVFLMGYPVEEYLRKMVWLICGSPGQVVSGAEFQREILNKATPPPEEQVQRFLVDRGSDDAAWLTFTEGNQYRHILTHRYRPPWSRNRASGEYGRDGQLLGDEGGRMKEQRNYIDRGQQERRRIGNLKENFVSGSDHIGKLHEAGAAAASAVFEAIVHSLKETEQEQ